MPTVRAHNASRESLNVIRHVDMVSRYKGFPGLFLLDYEVLSNPYRAVHQRSFVAHDEKN